MVICRQTAPFTESASISFSFFASFLDLYNSSACTPRGCQRHCTGSTHTCIWMTHSSHEWKQMLNIWRWNEYFLIFTFQVSTVVTKTWIKWRKEEKRGEWCLHSVCECGTLLGRWCGCTCPRGGWGPEWPGCRPPWGSDSDGSSQKTRPTCGWRSGLVSELSHQRRRASGFLNDTLRLKASHFYSFKTPKTLKNRELHAEEGGVRNRLQAGRSDEQRRQWFSFIETRVQHADL